MVHFRLGIVIVLGIYAIQCAVLLAAVFSPGLALAEFFVGAYVVGVFLQTIWRRVVTRIDAIEVSGFFIGGHKAIVTSSDLVSFRYYPVRRTTWGSIAIDVAIFELRTQSSPYDYRIARLGWSGNRQLFRTIATLVATSPITLDRRTQEALDAAAGL